MYMYVGQNCVLPEREIIGVFDMDNVSWSKISREFLKKAEDDGRVTSVSGDIPKSFVLLADGGVVLSAINTATLRQRLYSGISAGTQSDE